MSLDCILIETDRRNENISILKSIAGEEVEAKFGRMSKSTLHDIYLVEDVFASTEGTTRESNLRRESSRHH